MRIGPRVRARALGLLMVALARTLRFEFIGREAVFDLIRAGRALIFVGRHGDDLVHLAALRLMFPESRAVIIVRDDADGRALGAAVAPLGIEAIPSALDPTSGRSARGIVRFINLARDGRLGLLAVDGPDGPRNVVKPGAALIALRADALLVPCVAAARPAFRIFWRWDRHLVPLPFGRATVTIGMPIETRPREGRSPDTESLRVAIAAALERLAAST